MRWNREPSPRRPDHRPRDVLHRSTARVDMSPTTGMRMQLALPPLTPRSGSHPSIGTLDRASMCTLELGAPPAAPTAAPNPTAAPAAAAPKPTTAAAPAATSAQPTAAAAAAAGPAPTMTAAGVKPLASRAALAVVLNRNLLYLPYYYGAEK